MARWQLAKKGIVVLAMSLGSFSISTLSHAATSQHSYNGSACHGTTTAFEAEIKVSGTKIVNNSTDTPQIVCPIVKYTSGPGQYSDNISSLQVMASSGGVTCYLSVYIADPIYQGYGNGNVLEQFSGSGYSTGSFSIPLQSQTTGYWQGDYGENTWYYPELLCQLETKGAELVSYSVTEQGSAQTNTRITSAANCTPAPAANSYNYYLGEPNQDGYCWGDAVCGGYAQAEGTGYSMSCPALSGGGTWYQVAVLPSLNTDLMGCSFSGFSGTGPNGTGKGTWQWVPDDSSSNWPPQLITDDNSSKSTFTCAMENNPDDGDAAVLSYRTATSSGEFQEN
jgi:hypothetical protein